MKKITVLAAALMIIALANPAAQATDRGNNDRYWVGTWTTSPLAGPIAPFPGAPEPPVLIKDDITIRQIVHISLGGDAVRVRFSNEMGKTPLVISEARIALSAGGADIVGGTSRRLKFGGQLSITIPPGSPAVSDPVSLSLPPLSDVAISIYLAEATATHTFHQYGMQTNYVSSGNKTAEVYFPSDATPTQSYFFLTGLSVLAPKQAAAIVAFGDSITDGYGSTIGANHRWPDFLAARLQGLHSMNHLGVLNQGISGNRILRDSNFGSNPLENQSALARFDRDVLRQPGVKYVIVMLGINDITWSWFPFGGGDASAESIIGGYRQLIARAHELGLEIYGATLTPQQVLAFGGIPSPEQRISGEVKRQTINQWIRTSDQFDGVVDFDKAVLNPAQPDSLLPQYDSGDHIHLTDAGYKAMADAINLRLFKD